MNIDKLKIMANEYLNDRKAECSHIEYKASEIQQDKILKTICAYANNYYDNECSFIYIGVEEENNDSNKSIPKMPIKGILEGHLEIAKNTILSLKPYIYPNVIYEVVVNEYREKKYLLIIVERQHQGPYQVTDKVLNNKKISLKPGRYIRIESDTRLAKVNEEYDLLRKFAAYHFTSDCCLKATLDDLDYDYMREYLKCTSNRKISENATKEDIACVLNLLSDNEYPTKVVKNYAVLMFCKNPSLYIPYSHVEVISDTLGSVRKMEGKDFKGPIWKQYYSVLKFIEENFLRTITLREDGIATNKKISNFPFKAVEELIANAIVHKNYESKKCIQIYITNNEINIINYNKPLPPLTIEDLNERSLFHERDCVNPEIRDMFKSLGIIESYGTGIGEAKRACEENGSASIHYKLFENDTDITSVVIPCSSQYLELIGKKMRVENQKLGVDRLKLRIQDKISKSSYSNSVKNNLDRIVIEFYGTVFGPRNIIELLDCSNNTATAYISKLQEIDLIEKVTGLGKSRYKFK